MRLGISARDTDTDRVGNVIAWAQEQGLDKTFYLGGRAPQEQTAEFAMGLADSIRELAKRAGRTSSITDEEVMGAVVKGLTGDAKLGIVGQMELTENERGALSIIKRILEQEGVDADHINFFSDTSLKRAASAAGMADTNVGALIAKAKTMGFDAAISGESALAALDSLVKLIT